MPSKIRKRGENSYALCVTAGYTSDGTQRIFRKTVHADNSTQAKSLYKEFELEVMQGHAVSSDVPKMTLEEFYKYWIINYVDKQNAISTKVYNDNLFIRIKAFMGTIRIDKLQPLHIMNFINYLSQPDASVKGKPLSGRVIKGHYVLLKTMLNCAKKWQLIAKNPCDSVDSPKSSKPKKRTVDDETVAIFFDKLESETLKHRLWVMLAFGRGLRREEIFGLKWGDIDFDREKISINRAVVYVHGSGIVEKSTKSDNSYRVLSLPPTLSKMLINWRSESKAAVIRRNKRRKVVSIEDPVGKDSWVFQLHDGSVGRPHSFTTFLRRFCKKANIDSISPHMFRHMSGSYLLRAGVDIATISAELGHGDKGFTMRTYIHEIESEKERSTKEMETILATISHKDVKNMQNK